MINKSANNEVQPVALGPMTIHGTATRAMNVVVVVVVSISPFWDIIGQT
jgi:hypothetical protein